MNNNVIDVTFIAAKIAAIKNEKARMIVGGASLRKHPMKYITNQ